MKLEPRLAKTLELMVNKLMTTMNDKLDPQEQTVLSHANRLKRTSNQLDEDASELQVAKILVL